MHAKDLVGISAVCDRLGVTRNTVIRWSERGSLPAPDALRTAQDRLAQGTYRGVVRGARSRGRAGGGEVMSKPDILPRNLSAERKRQVAAAWREFFTAAIHGYLAGGLEVNARRNFNDHLTDEATLTADACVKEVLEFGTYDAIASRLNPKKKKEGDHVMRDSLKYKKTAFDPDHKDFAPWQVNGLDDAALHKLWMKFYRSAIGSVTEGTPKERAEFGAELADRMMAEMWKRNVWHGKRKYYGRLMQREDWDDRVFEREKAYPEEAAINADPSIPYKRETPPLDEDTPF